MGCSAAGYAEEAAPPGAAPHVPALQVTGTFTAARRPTPPMGGQVVPPDPHADRAKGRPSLGVLEVINEGPTKGTRYQLDTPRMHLGRREHNDVSIPDESVSDSHARLQRREGTWYLFDLESTNGTYVGGTRISDEVALSPGAEVRFGGVKMAFRPMGGVARPSGETRVIVGVKSPARLATIPERNRPYDSPAQRFQILELKRLLGWTRAEAASAVMVCPNTIGNWEAQVRAGEDTVGSTVQPSPPVVRMADTVRSLVQTMKRLGFGSDDLIALTLLHAGWEISTRSVGRILRAPRPLRVESVTEFRRNGWRSTGPILSGSVRLPRSNGHRRLPFVSRAATRPQSAFGHGWECSTAGQHREV